MTLSLGMITVDSADPIPLARWWADRFGAQIKAENEGWFVIVEGGTLPVLLAVQKVADPTPGKNRIHLDLNAEDLDAAVAELTEAGASLVAEYDDGFRWVTLADPQGNQFCVAGGH